MRKMVCRPGNVVAILVLVLCSSSCAEQPKTGDYDVHEWGVLAGCSGTDQYFVTSRPLKVLAIREPIVYIHSRDKKPFSLQVNFKRGEPTDTYPPAQVSSESIVWDNVELTTPAVRNARSVRQEDFVPLKQIIPILNDVDADELHYQDHTSRFLFYEGNIPFDNRISAEHSIDEKAATAKNSGKMPVYDVLVVAPQRGGHPFAIDVFVAHIAKLNPGESITAELVPVSSDFSFGQQLVTLGFTEKEALSFDKLWKRPFLYPINTAGWGHLIYRLSEEECNQLTELQFNPKPKECIRALYVLVKSFQRRQ